MAIFANFDFSLNMSLIYHTFLSFSSYRIAISYKNNFFTVSERSDLW
jgi:hypothetical protein